MSIYTGPSKKPTPTPAEQGLYNALQSHGLRPQKQYRVLSYWADLAFPDQMVIVEVMGSAHFGMKSMAHDFRRERRLQKAGWCVVKYTNSEIVSDAYRCAKEIKEILTRNSAEGRSDAVHTPNHTSTEN